MTREEYEARLEEYRGAWATVARSCREAIILGVVRHAADAARLAAEADASQLFGLGSEASEIERAALGAALSLGWPGPAMDEEDS